MADNVQITAGSGTNIATDDVAGVHYQRVKVDLGGDGAASPLVRGQQTKANSIPVTLASNDELYDAILLHGTSADGAGSVVLVGTEADDGSALRIRSDNSGRLKTVSASSMEGVYSVDGFRTQRFAPISVSSSGDNTIIAANPDYPITVLGVVLIAAGSVNVTFKDAGGAALTGAMPLVANSGFSSGVSPLGQFCTNVNAALVLNLSAAVQVSGWIVYVFGTPGFGDGGEP